MSVPEEKRRWWGWGAEDGESPEFRGLLSHLTRVVGPFEERRLPPPDLNELDLRPPELPAGLEEVLVEIVGRENVRQDRFRRVLHGAGRSYRDLIRLRLGLVPCPPDAVVYPDGHDQVRRALDAAEVYRAAVVPFGGGSSVVGGLEPNPEARPLICLDLTRMNRVLEISPENLTARVEAGIFGPHLEEILGRQGFTLGHFPPVLRIFHSGRLDRGPGRGGTNQPFTAKWKTWSWESARPGPAGKRATPDVPAHAAGGDLIGLLVGSEGALGVITEALVKIKPQRPKRPGGSHTCSPILKPGSRRSGRCSGPDAGRPP